MVEMIFRHWNVRARDRRGESSFPGIMVEAPLRKFFLEKDFYRVTYEKFKIEDGIDVEINLNLEMLVGIS